MLREVFNLYGVKRVGPAEQENRFADIVEAEHHHQQTGKTQAKTAVRRAAVAEEIQVELDRFQMQPFFQRLFGSAPHNGARAVRRW